MTWTAPHTYTVSELVTASTLNTDIRDNLSFLHSPPTVLVYNSINQSINNNTVTNLTYDSEYYDNATIHSTSSNTNRLTAPIDGVYLCTLSVSFASGSNARYIAINDGTNELALQEVKSLSSAQFTMNCNCQVLFSAGEFANSEVWQDSGGALNVLATGNYSPVFGMTWIGAGT